MSRLPTLLIAALMSWVAIPAAQAHFVWIVIEDGSSGRVDVSFSETPEPGAAHLIEKLESTKAWVRTADGKTTDLALKAEEIEGEELATLTGKVSKQDRPYSVEGQYLYGVHEVRGTAILLQYYAKALACQNLDQVAKVARAEKLDLDVVPVKTADGWELQVLYKGKPAAGAEVYVSLPEEVDQPLKTDDKGKVTFKRGNDERLVLRARWAEPNKTGKFKDQEFAQSWHITTLTMNRPEKGAGNVAGGAGAGGSAAAGSSDTAKNETAKNEPAKNEKAASETAAKDKASNEEPRKADPEAHKLLTDAREARAMWNNFPGFSARLQATSDGQTVTGRVTMNAKGQVTLEGFDQDYSSWINQQMRLIAQHRLPSPFTEFTVSFVDDLREHPMGRLVRLNEEPGESSYRIKDAVITEVNRSMGATKFTISVLEVARNNEDKYLPSNFSVSYWDKETGRLKSNEAYHQTWSRIGEYDMPETTLVIMNGKDTHRVLKMTFDDYKFLNPAETASNAGQTR